MKRWLIGVVVIALACGAIYFAMQRSIAKRHQARNGTGTSTSGPAARGSMASATAGPNGRQSTSNAGTPSPASGDPGSQSVEELSAKVQQAAKSANAADYVLAARERELTTLEAAFAFVRDDIDFESYSGILRGPDATFHARAGNAFDRAMLLAAILQSNKTPVRLVTGQLSRTQAELLFQRMFERSPVAMRSPTPGSLTARIFDRAHRDYDAIARALGSHFPAVSSPARDDVVKEIEQHAWVQAQRNGQWIDLDPSFRDSTVGRAYAPVQQQFDTPPPAWMQQVTIRVVAENLEGGTLKRTISLETTIPAYRLIDRPVYLLHHVYRPFNGQGGDLQFVFGNKDVQEPVLIVDGQRTVGGQIDFGAGASATGAAPANAVQSVANLFGAAPPAPANANARTFVAEWLEFELGFPDGHHETTRRVLADRAGTAWRAAANHDPSKLRDLARNKDGVIASQNLYNIWLSAGRHDLLAFTATAADLSTGIPARNPKAPTLVETLWPMAIRDFGWFIVSDHIVVPAINDIPGVRFYPDSPRIFIWGVGPDPGGNPNEVAVTSDLRRDGLRGVANDAAQSNALAQHKLWFGALEGALEHEIAVPPLAGASFVTTSSLTESGDLVALAAGSAVSAKDPETQAQLQAALAKGDTIVVPKQVLAGGVSGWWQVARQTGDVSPVLGGTLNGAAGETFGKKPINRQAEYQWRQPKNPGSPGGSGTANIKNPEDPIYKRGFKNPNLVCRELEALDMEGAEDRSTSGRVCEESTPAWVNTGVVVSEIVFFLVLAWEAWQWGQH